jgi:hypothetical protein
MSNYVAPHNFRVDNSDGNQKLIFDVMPTATESKIFIVESSGPVLLGTTTTNELLINPPMSGTYSVYGKSKSQTGWGGDGSPESVTF